MRNLGDYIKAFGRRNPVEIVALLHESKNISTYRGSTSVKDLAANTNVTMMPMAQSMMRRNHQMNKTKLDNLMNGLSSDIEMSIRMIRGGSARTPVIKILKEQFKKVYDQSFDLGISASATGLLPDSSVKTAEDTRWINSAFSDEMKYFNRFLDQSLSGRISPAQISTRVRMYASACRGIYEAGRVLGSPSNSLIYWVWTPEAQHCASCVYLRDHSPYTKRTLPTTPRTGATECLTYCKCHLRIVLSSEKSVKRVESISVSKSNHISYLNQLKNRRSSTWIRSELSNRAL